MSARSFMRDVLDGLAADYADIRLEQTEQSRIVFRGPDLDSIGRTFERGGCIRVHRRGNWGVATFNTIDENLHDLAVQVAAQVDALPPRDAPLVPLGPLSDEVRLPPADDPRKVELAAKHDLIRHYNSILLKTKGIVSTLSVYQDRHRRVGFYSTEDRFIEQEFIETGFLCQAVARDGTNIQPYSDSFGKIGGFDSLRNREPMVERIARVAVELLRAEPVTAGSYTVIIDPLLGGVFAHEAFGHLSEADHIAENERLRELMTPGRRYGTEELTIVDDATMPGERGSYRYDDEGTPASRVELIKDGAIAGHLHDRRSAAQMNEGVTGNARAVSYRFAPIVRMANTYIEPREADLDDMLESVENGLYVAGSGGGMTELESFTFAAQYAQLIEHGRRTKMVRDVTLSGNVFETLKNIVAIGNDLTMFGGLGGCGKGGQSPLPVGVGAPHLMIRNVVVGGR